MCIRDRCTLRRKLNSTLKIFLPSSNGIVQIHIKSIEDTATLSNSLIVSAGTVNCFPVWMTTEVFWYTLLITLTRCKGQNLLIIIFYKTSLSRISNAFWKLIKTTWVSKLNFRRSSITWYNTKMRSIVDQPFLKPVCLNVIDDEAWRKFYKNFGMRIRPQKGKGSQFIPSTSLMKRL